MSSRYLAAADDYLRHPTPRYRTYVDLRKDLDAYADEERRDAAKAIAHPDRPLLLPPPNPQRISARESAPPSPPTTASH
ncbi:TAP transporter inhibitor ICP47 [Macacine alphaherpesvirus 1]|nr:TAP transporter inhibitor ICP47 [Macacine alphaherpesvirus 1]